MIYPYILNESAFSDEDSEIIYTKLGPGSNSVMHGTMHNGAEAFSIELERQITVCKLRKVFTNLRERSKNT